MSVVICHASVSSDMPFAHLSSFMSYVYVRSDIYCLSVGTCRVYVSSTMSYIYISSDICFVYVSSDKSSVSKVTSCLKSVIPRYIYVSSDILCSYVSSKLWNLQCHEPIQISLELQSVEVLTLRFKAFKGLQTEESVTGTQSQTSTPTFNVIHLTRMKSRRKETLLCMQTQTTGQSQNVTS